MRVMSVFWVASLRCRLSIDGITGKWFESSAFTLRKVKCQVIRTSQTNLKDRPTLIIQTSLQVRLVTLRGAQTARRGPTRLLHIAP